MSRDINDKAVIIATPLLNSSGKPAGVLYADLPAKDIIASTIEGVHIGKTGFAYILDKGGLMLAHPDYKLVQEFDAKTTEWGRKVLAAPQGALHYTTSAGIERLLNFRKDPESGWIAVSTLDVSEISEATSSIRNISLGIMLVGAVLVGLIIFLVTRPIIKDLLHGVNYAKAVVDMVKEAGGIPFLTDCNTLYVGRRKHALEHLEAAQENGFSPLSTGCQIIIADGLKGTDEVEVPVEGGEYVTAAKIGRAVMDADVFISLAHFKGHDSTGFGGAIKNIGMGCGSRAGKMEQHCSGKVSVNPKRCRGCGACARNCAQGAISYGEDRKAVIDEEKCVGCGRCIGHCNFDAIRNNNFNAGELLNRKMAEYAKAVLAGRPGFHINMVIDISPSCDCCPTNDAPILPDIGMFASFDPVALDEACVDACNRQQPLPDSQLADNMAAEGFCDHHDHFTNNSPETDWRTCLEHAEKIGVGTRRYELVRVR